ncbi:MAG: hypothetical protein CMG34_07295 [Candidatus Marinimicrobia bacterium]|nr:hypothetical protein [Candidatus Neomarinimicrobiota bacterium]|tara:strand:+ start:281 stop:778 length:498 start_codon:yes stop_codon:yes gene_type:complete
MSTETTDSKTWDVLATVEKWHRAADRKAGLPPDEVVEKKDNLLLNEGITVLLNLLCGISATAFSNGNAYIGVGDSSTAAAAGQTGLQASSNKDYQGMESGYPSVTGQTVTFRSIWASAEGNFDWNEWTVANGSSDSATNLNRKVAALGTKASGSEWTLTVAITVS